MRDRRLELFGFVAVAFVAAWVGIRRFPNAELVRRAERWPVVGSAVFLLRERARPPVSVELPPSGILKIVNRYLPELDRRDAANDGLSESTRARVSPGERPPALLIASGLEPVLPLPGEPADSARVARALELLGSDAREELLGDYRLLTDVVDDTILDRWSRIVALAEWAWVDRYGVEPIGRAAETIALFRTEAAFRYFAEEEPRLSALDPAGFVARGLVALYAENLDPAVLDSAFQHELAHLLARRSIGPALPGWLAEGLAEDFGQAELVDGDRLDFDAVAGAVHRRGNRFEIFGGIAAIDLLGQEVAAGRVPQLSELQEVDPVEFAGGERGAGRYAAAFGWIRFLLADPARASGFRAFLAELSRGEELSLERLDAQLPLPLDELALGFAEWVALERRRVLTRHGLPTELARSAAPLD